jgi:hypothetical protein
MAMARGAAGETRQCPHCRATILASASVCPGCQHHLRFDKAALGKEPGRLRAFHLEGLFRNDSTDAAREYSVVIAIRNDRGEVLARHVVGVGALRPDETRTVSLDVDMTALPADRNR